MPMLVGALNTNIQEINEQDFDAIYNNLSFEPKKTNTNKSHWGDFAIQDALLPPPRNVLVGQKWLEQNR